LRGAREASTKADALALLDAFPQGSDAATLDINLGEDGGDEIAAALDLRGIPFIVTTGYDDPAILGRFHGHEMVLKPFALHELEAALKRLKQRNQPKSL
jgi:DNA-binding response OmpR family regulator